MNRVQGKEVVDNIDSIKFIGIGHKGIEILNKISKHKKEYMNLATIDIKSNDIDENIKEQIVYANDIYEWCWWSKCDFFELVDTIGTKTHILTKLIKNEKMLVVICDDCDLVALHTLLEIGKIASKDNILVLPIIIKTHNKSKLKQSDSEFFVKKINKEVGPAISIGKRDFNNIEEEYDIINLIIEMFIENMMVPCSLNIDYDDMLWIFEKSKNNIRISISTINQNDSVEEIKDKVSKSIVSKSRSKASKKIIINAITPKDTMGYNQAFKIIQQVAICIQEMSHEDCKITFSIRAIEKKDNTIDIMAIQV